MNYKSRLLILDANIKALHRNHEITDNIIDELRKTKKFFVKAKLIRRAEHYIKVFDRIDLESREYLGEK